MAQAAEKILELPDDILNCPICFERYKKPKTLPYVHTFCEDCLSTYIANYVSKDTKKEKPTGFTCPICRTIVFPVECSSDSSTWAKEFPTNSFIVDVLGVVSFQTQEKFCDSCHRQGKQNQTANWCKNCKSCLCNSCRAVHDVLGLGHEVISIEETKTSPKNILEPYMTCPKHKEKLDLFCADHKSVACPKCIAIDHRKCETVSTADDYAHKLRESKDVSEMVKTYKEYYEILDKFRNGIKAEKQRKRNQSDQIEVTVFGLMEDIRNHLDVIERDFNETLSQSRKSAENELDKKEEECSIIQATIDQSKKMLEASVKLGGTTQFLNQVMKSKSEIKDYMERIQKLKIKSSSITIEVNEKLKNFKSLVPMVGPLKQSINTTISPMLYGKSMSERSPKMIKLIRIRTKSDKQKSCVTGILYLDGNRFIICDSANKKVKLFRVTGDCLSEYDFPSVRDVCKVDDGTVAVTLDGQNEIHILHLKNEMFKFVSKIHCNEICYGINFFQGSFMVTFPNGQKEIQFLSRNGSRLNTLSKDEADRNLCTDYPDHIAASDEFLRIVVTMSSAPQRASHAIIFDGNFEILSKIKIMTWLKKPGM